MDDFSLDRQELTGALISMEFGQGGRIQQLWASDPTAPDESEEFQFVAPPLMMGEETTEDYFPGTILIGARAHPDEPWIVSRNARAEPMEEEEEGSVVGFEYEFTFLDEIRATGKFYEIAGAIPQIAWDVEIINQSRRSLEIGELGFPLALNNVLEGFPATDRGVRELWNDRVYVHKFIGGAASYVFAQRMTARPPGLAIFPGGDTRWEFFNHVPASLNTSLRWEGIPVVYVHSQAAIEREGWPEWFGGHTSVVFEPGEGRTYRMRFAPADRFQSDNLTSTLIACERPALKVFPAAVAPVDVGIAVEVSGTTPTRFFTDLEMELETDADEDGGFCYMKPPVPGAVKLSFEDTEDRLSEAHFLFTEPIGDLIRKRAQWILENQICREEGILQSAILAGDLASASPIADPESFIGPFGIESSLADALFLAEKNTIYPEVEEIEALDEYLDSFIRNSIQNPGDASVGCCIPDFRAVAGSFGRPQVYSLLFNLYHTMSRVAAGPLTTRHGQCAYLREGARTLTALFANSARASIGNTGIPLMSYAVDLIRDMREQGLKAEADQCAKLLDRREIELSRHKYPFQSEGQWNTGAYEEVFAVSRRRAHDELEERAFRCAYAARSLSPDWWWYGSDKRWLEESESTHPGVFDRGELCMSPSTISNSLMFFKTLDRDYSSLPEATLRLAFGGMMGIWSLIRPDGAASMAFCPDAASKQFGMLGVTGDVGVGLFHYLRGVGSYVLPSRTSGITTFGCHFEVENSGERDWYVIRPWDGVGRKVVARQIGFELIADAGQVQEVRIESRKREAVVVIKNHADADLVGQVRIRGLWGNTFIIDGQEVCSENGEIKVVVSLPPTGTVRTEISVKK
ncbi:MAG: DUF5695 domain-containing protein [Fimbriimonas sp.]|nr:DUF5695 domain-containing protein [Fimbriimonas sp.]